LDEVDFKFGSSGTAQAREAEEGISFAFALSGLGSYE
jgi:hypothetical protein